jgi:hypothetical protein
MRADDEHEGGVRARRLVTGAVGVGLAVIVTLGAALGGPLVFSAPRWSPDLPAASAPQAVLPSGLASQSAAPQPLGARAGSSLDLTWLLVVVGALGVAAVVALVLVLLRRLGSRRPPASSLPVDGLTVAAGPVDAEPSVEVGVAAMRRGLRRALDVLDDGRAPSDAITEAWLGLQEAAEDAGFRRGAAETPTEFTARILRRLDVDPDALETLRRLYATVRFGGVVASPSDVDLARRALGTLERQWSVPGGAQP